ncbi:hypothetical protein [Gluconobacter cerinus]|uniref:hypothetical protein n=1 Tax=Gluconobacter cerinus TaxID=38307 RepID=UPI0039EAFBA5
MSTDDRLLIIFAAIFFLALGLVGLLCPKLRLWRWADVIYYPLGATGAILLFFSNEINRTLIRIEAKQAAAESAWRTMPNLRPELHLSPGSAELLAARYEWFGSLRDLSDTCATVIEGDCPIYREYGKALRAAFGSFVVPKTVDPIAVARAEEQFCSVGLAYVTRLDADTSLPLGVFHMLKDSLAALSKGAMIDQVKTRLEDNITAQQTLFRGLIDAKEKAFTEPYLRLHRQHALDLLGQLSWCATRKDENAESLKTFDAWQAEEDKRALSRQQFARDLKAVRESNKPSALQQTIHMIQQQWWPYILILALSIKFGKASAGVAEDISNGWRRLGSRIRRCIRYFR